MAGIITSIPPLVEQPPGNSSSNPAGLPGITYTAAIPILPQTWTGLQTFNNGSVQYAGSISGFVSVNGGTVASGAVSFPAVTGPDILLANNNTATIKNKSIDGLQNTLTNIPAAAFGSTTGTGAVVLSNSPVITGGTFNSPALVTPTLGVASATTINKVTITPPATGATLTILDGVTAQFNASVTFTGQFGKTIAFDRSIEFDAGADGTKQTFPATSGTVITSVSAAGGSLTGTYPNPTVSSVPASALPNPTATTLGGIESLAAVGSKWINTISTAGVPTATQPAFTDISGSVAATQMPALTGDITTVAGTVATTLATNIVSNAKFRQSAALSVVGVTGNATANVADIVGTANQALRVNGAGTALAFGAIDLSQVAAATGILQAASHPALSGDVANTAGSLATTIQPNAVTNAKLATMPAFTFHGNNTSGVATPTNVDIAALTAKASPVATDLVMISDQAASGAWKKVTVSALASAGSVASYNGRTGTVTATSTDVPIRNYLAGLTLSTAGSSATFSTAGGVATDNSSTSLMALTSTYTKTTSAWAVGTAAGSLDTGSIANSTWYHVFLMQRPDTGVVDVAISLSASAPTTGGAIPAAYTLFRRIGSMKTNGSAQWMQFTQLGDEFLWSSPPLDFSVAAVGNGTATIFTLISVPTGVQVNALIEGYTSGAASGTQVYFSSLDQTDIATPNGTSSIITGSFGALKLNLRTSTTATIRGRANGASLTVNASVLGWIDTRGKLN